MKRIRSLNPVRSLVLLAFLASGGCGLSDYHNRMDSQRKRVQDFDEANALLDDPIGFPLMPPQPTAKDPKELAPAVAAWPFEFFLRLPRGFGTMPKDANLSLNDFGCFRFSGGDVALNIFVVAANTLDPKDAKAREDFGKYSPTTFRFYLRKAAVNYYAKSAKVNFLLQEKELPRFLAKAVSAYPDETAAAKIGYSHFQLTDEGKVQDVSIFDVYIYEDASRQVGIIVHRSASNANVGLLKQSVEACLGSLDASNDAKTKRSQFKRAR